MRLRYEVRHDQKEIAQKGREGDLLPKHTTPTRNVFVRERAQRRTSISMHPNTRAKVSCAKTRTVITTTWRGAIKRSPMAKSQKLHFTSRRGEGKKIPSNAR